MLIHRRINRSLTNSRELLQMTAGELLSLLHRPLCLIDMTRLKCQHVYWGYNVKVLGKKEHADEFQWGTLKKFCFWPQSESWIWPTTKRTHMTGKGLFLIEGHHSRWHMHTVCGFLVNLIITPVLCTSSVLINGEPESNMEKTHSPTGLQAYFTCTVITPVIKIEASSRSLRQSDRDTGQDWYGCLRMVIMDIRMTAARQSLLMLSRSQRKSVFFGILKK